MLLHGCRAYLIGRILAVSAWNGRIRQLRPAGSDREASQLPCAPLHSGFKKIEPRLTQQPGFDAGANPHPPTMSLLNYARDERLVIVGLTAAIIGVVATARMLLTQMRDTAEIKPPQPTTQYITQETEDSLKPTTLDTILGHYNYAIREIAAKIVCDRAVNDGESIDILLWGITRPEYDERMKCLRTLAFITDPRTKYYQ